MGEWEVFDELRGEIGHAERKYIKTKPLLCWLLGSSVRMHE
jgi:hypothetical protein